MIFALIGFALLVCLGAGLFAGGMVAAQSPSFVLGVIEGLGRLILPALLDVSPETIRRVRGESRQNVNSNRDRIGR